METATFRQVIGLWPSVKELADSLGEKPFTVEKWRTRNSVPPRVWRRLIRAAHQRDLPVTADLLVDIAAEPADSESRAVA